MQYKDLEFSHEVIFRCPKSKFPATSYCMLSTPDNKYNVMRMKDNRALFIPPETEIEITGKCVNFSVYSFPQDEFDKLMEDMNKMFNKFDPRRN